MSAVLQVYTDAGCTSELVGTLQIGSVDGLSGTLGEVVTTSVWVKNTGNLVATSVVLTETSDTDGRGSYSLNGVDYNNTTITLGNIASGANVRVYIKVTVAESTLPHVDEPLNFTCAGTTF